MRERIEEFLERKTREINDIAEYYPEKKSLFIDYDELSRFDLELAEELIQNPDTIIPIFRKILFEKLKPISEFVNEHKCYVRFYNLPREQGYTLLVRDITSDYVGKLIAIDGTVTKITDVLPKVLVARFVCNKCDTPHDVYQETRFLYEPPFCETCRKKTDFRFIPDESLWTDIQRLEIQEPLEILKGGEQARRIEIWAEDDITDLVKPGDKITVTGIVRLLKPKKRGAIYYKFIEANNIEGIEIEFEEIEIAEEDEKKIKELASDPRIYDKIIDSIAPTIYGYREVKEAIALQLFGGRPKKTLPDGTRLRPDIHILLVGDPGVAKSRMLQYVNQIAPKSIYVTGKGTTGAGLTATAEKDEFAEGGWTLKAGALVLAGGGIAAIDEFDKMSKDDREAMHEAMEQQTISVAKAGIVTKFLANTAILAAANPKFGRFDTYKPLGEQFDIPPTLLSRFDLIFPIRDILDKERDSEIAEHMLRVHKGGEEAEEVKPEIDPELFRKYIAYSRKNVFPILTEDAAEKIKNFYVSLRASSKETVKATPRQLEALIRLSEASAKIRLSDKVTVSDAERAIRLTEFVLREIAYDESTGQIDIDRVITQYPKSARDRIRIIENIIRELIERSDDGMAGLDEIIEEAREHNIDKFKTEEIINELKSKGIIYEPRHGRFMFTEG
ncbi:MAG: AAA family ATPase [Candidatus Altiarchaeales archaeon]|nr:MAG: AAA family ATPase [Candidatus Altiarchaeales archaeon]RLI94982.1 MAG: AAA family ATPase [Candidatus Altiarchaeales archaeon]HDO82730.1 minichromosome maintenance protein MCM [Candidatus Altiarchaeales archaeon]HEX55379.1 minichromosome maintenance protein MCM [Candidatus Altiarchaeales archaeon]